MTAKKDLIAPAETEAETKTKSVVNRSTSLVINVSESSGAAAIFDLNQRLYDDGLISSECYIAIEAVIAEFMNCSVEDGE